MVITEDKELQQQQKGLPQQRHKLSFVLDVYSYREVGSVLAFDSGVGTHRLA